MEKSFEAKRGLLLSPGKHITQFTKQRNHQSASSWENMKNNNIIGDLLIFIIHTGHFPTIFWKNIKKWQQDSSMASPGAETSLHRAEISTGCPSYWPRTSGRTKRCDGSTGASWITRFLEDTWLVNLPQYPGGFIRGLLILGFHWEGSYWTRVSGGGMLGTDRLTSHVRRAPTSYKWSDMGPLQMVLQMGNWD